MTLYVTLVETDYEKLKKHVELFMSLPANMEMAISDSYNKGSAYGHMANVKLMGVSRSTFGGLVFETNDVVDPTKVADRLNFKFGGDYYTYPITLQTHKNKEEQTMGNQIALIPLYDRVLVKTDEQIEKTESGIILPVESRKKSNTGTVVGVGEGTPATPMKVKVGDRVLYQRYAGLDVEWEGNAYTMILAPEIIAIIDPKFQSAQIGYRDINDAV